MEDLKKVSITEKEKHIFYSENNDGDILFPELEHGQKVELEGTITRENEATNTLGFRYEEHVLTCWPFSGKLSDFKSKILSQREERMFPEHAKITGTIQRPHNKEEPQQKKPQIIFDDITPIEKPNNQKKTYLIDFKNPLNNARQRNPKPLKPRLSCYSIKKIPLTRPTATPHPGINCLAIARWT